MENIRSHVSMIIIRGFFTSSYWYRMILASYVGVKIDWACNC